MQEMRVAKAQRHGFMAVWIGALVLWVGHTAAAQGPGTSGETFRARLTTVPVEATMLPTVAGSGSLTAVLAGRKLTITGTFEGLRSPATVARIHRGARGVRGPAVFDLTVSKATSGSLSGSLDLTPAQIEDLRNARLYVQIHSEGAPEGNLWGWVLR